MNKFLLPIIFLLSYKACFGQHTDYQTYQPKYNNNQMQSNCDSIYNNLRVILCENSYYDSTVLNYQLDTITSFNNSYFKSEGSHRLNKCYQLENLINAYKLSRSISAKMNKVDKVILLLQNYPKQWEPNMVQYSSLCIELIKCFDYKDIEKLGNFFLLVTDERILDMGISLTYSAGNDDKFLSLMKLVIKHTRNKDPYNSCINVMNLYLQGDVRDSILSQELQYMQNDSLFLSNQKNKDFLDSLTPKFKKH